jgi:hypothetical protein
VPAASWSRPGQRQQFDPGGRDLRRHRIARGEDDRDGLAGHLAGSEEQRGQRRAVDAAGVVDDRQHRPAFGLGGEQGQGRHADRVRLDRSSGAAQREGRTAGAGPQAAG